MDTPDPITITFHGRPSTLAPLERKAWDRAIFRLKGHGDFPGEKDKQEALMHYIAVASMGGMPEVERLFALPDDELRWEIEDFVRGTGLDDYDRVMNWIACWSPHEE